MDFAQIEQRLNGALTLDELHISGEGSHVNVVAVGALFDGMSRVKKQQAIYAPLKDLIADGSLHALTIKAFTPEEWATQKKFVLPGNL